MLAARQWLVSSFWRNSLKGLRRASPSSGITLPLIRRSWSESQICVLRHRSRSIQGHSDFGNYATGLDIVDQSEEEVRSGLERHPVSNGFHQPIRIFEFKILLP